MAETKNVFVTKTKNSFLPTIQAFTDYLSQYTQQQMQLSEKAFQLQRKQKMEEYGSDVQKRFASAKSPNELNALTGQVLGEAVQQGYNEIIPMIGQYSSVYSRGMQLEQQQQGAKATLGMLDNDQKVYWGNKVRTIGDLRNELTPMFGEGNEAMLADILFKAPKVETKELITRQADTGKIIYSSGSMGPDGKWVDVQNKDVLKQGGVPYIETNNQPGMQQDEQLNPLLQQQYSTALYQQEQDAKSDRQFALQSEMNRLKQEDLDLSNLNQTATAAWRSKTAFYEKAFEEQLNKVRTENNDDIDDIDYLPQGKTYIQVRSKYFSGKDMNQPTLAKADEVEQLYATDPEYQLMKSLEETTTQMKYAFSVLNMGTKEYQRAERMYMEAPENKTKQKDDEWALAGPEEKANMVNNWYKTRKNP